MDNNNNNNNNNNISDDFQERIFQPYCALGLVTDGDHLSGHSVDQKYYITVTVDTHVYILLHLQHLIYILGPSGGKESRIGKINCLVRRCGRTLFVSRGPYIELWDQNTPNEPLITFTNHHKNVHLLQFFGTSLISISEDGLLIVWQIEGTTTSENTDWREMKFITLNPLQTDIKIEQHGMVKLNEIQSNFQSTILFHPNTFINKVLIGGNNGIVLLFNTNSMKLIYKFEFLKDSKETDKSVLSIAQSSIPEVCAFSFSDKSIIVHNIKLDKTLFVFQESLSVALCLSFRTDGIPLLCSGNSNGFISIWDLEKRRLVTSFKAHEKAVSQLMFPPNSNLLYSIGRDNSLKHWIFDLAENKCRLVTSRSGHHGAISALTTFPLESYESILTGSFDQDSRLFPISKNSSIFHSFDYSRTFSFRSNINSFSKKTGMEVEVLKAPKVLGIDTSVNRMKDWGSVITWHKNHPFIYIWHITKFNLERKVCSSEKNPSFITSAVISPCGNFFAIGTSSGWIEKFNIQSGKSSGKFFDPSLKPQKIAHSQSVFFLKMDAITKYLVSGSSESYFKIWSFHRQELLHNISLSGGITSMELFRENNLLAISTDNHDLTIFDLETQKISRKLENLDSRVTCLTFSLDGRWIILATADSVLRIYDIPSSKVIDYFKTEKPIVCLKFLPKGDFLVTVFAGNNYFHLWANRMFWKKVFLKKLPENPPLVYTNETPNLFENVDDLKKSNTPKIICDMNEKNEKKKKRIKSEISTELSHQILEGEHQRDEETPLDFYLFTKSKLPKSKWTNIHYLDTIKKRNKPIEPPKKGKTAPFFLELIEDLNPRFNSESNDQNEKESTSQLVSKFVPNLSSPFSIALLKGKEEENYRKAFDLLKSLNPSSIDYEIISIPPHALSTFLEMINFELDSHQNFELVQAYLNLFLKRQGETLMKNSQAIEQAQKVIEKLKNSWPNLESSYQKSLCLVKYFSGIQL